MSGSDPFLRARIELDVGPGHPWYDELAARLGTGRPHRVAVVLGGEAQTFELDTMIRCPDQTISAEGTPTSAQFDVGALIVSKVRSQLVKRRRNG